VTLAGMDIDPAALEQALEYGLTRDDLASVTIGDFVFQPPQAKLSAIVANPPYIRHQPHFCDRQTKTQESRSAYHRHYIRRPSRFAYLLSHPCLILAGR